MSAEAAKLPAGSTLVIEIDAWNIRERDNWGSSKRSVRRERIPADDRFPQAVQRLDLFHVQQHQWRLAAELHGKGTPEAKAWVSPYIEGLKTTEAETRK